MDTQLNHAQIQRAKLVLRSARKKLGRNLGGQMTVAQLFTRHFDLPKTKVEALVRHFIPAPFTAARSREVA